MKNIKSALYKFIMSGEATNGLDPLSTVPNHDIAQVVISYFDEYLKDAMFDYPMSIQKIELIKRLAVARVYEEFSGDMEDLPLVAFQCCMAQFSGDLELIPNNDKWWIKTHIIPRFAIALVSAMEDANEIERTH